MSEIQTEAPQQASPPEAPPAEGVPHEIDLNDMGDRFKVAEYLLKLRDAPPFADDSHPAARFVAEQVALFADEQMRALMGADREEEPEAPPFPFTDDEIKTLKALVVELRQPVAAPKPAPRPAPQAMPAQRQAAAQPLPAARPRPQPAPGAPTMSHIPGRRQQPLPAVGTVRQGPLTRPTLSKEEMEATTHAQAQVVARRAGAAFLGFRTGANPGRDHAGTDGE